MLSQHQAKEIFIVREDRLYWRETGVEAGYLSVPPDIRERQREYPYVWFDREKMKVHRVMWLHENGVLPDYRKKPHYVIDHINEFKHDCNRWNLRKITAREHQLLSTAMNVSKKNPHAIYNQCCYLVK